MQPASYFPNSASEASQRQELVDAHFEAGATRWKDLYERRDLYGVIHRERRERVLALVDELTLPQRSLVLDAGCGAGLTAVALAQRGFHVEAVDRAASMVRLTTQFAAQAMVSERLSVHLGDVCQLSFPDNTFVVALAMGVTPYANSVFQMLQELTRVVKPSGYVIINADNRWRLNHILDPRRFPALSRLRWAVKEGLARYRSSRPKQNLRLHAYSLKEFDSLIPLAGLSKVKGLTLGFGPFTLFNFELLPNSVAVKLHHCLQNSAENDAPWLRSLGAQYIVMARKGGKVTAPSSMEGVRHA